MKRSLKVTITIIIVLLIAGTIFYPKFKPVLSSRLRNEMPARPAMRQQQQKLNVSGYIVVPGRMSELVNSTGTLRPDEEVDLSFETSGKIVGINFREVTRVSTMFLMHRFMQLTQRLI